MERKIGERFDFKGKTLEVVEQNGCEGCYFDGCDDCSGYVHVSGSCTTSKPHGNPVIFKKADKSLVEIVQEIEEYLNKTK